MHRPAEVDNICPYADGEDRTCPHAPDAIRDNRVCSLIATQRRIVFIAKLLDKALNNGDDAHEYKFSSGDFLTKLNDIVGSIDDNRERAILNAETYVFLSFDRILVLGQDLRNLIDSFLLPQMIQKKQELHELGFSIEVADTDELHDRAKSAGNEINSLKMAQIRPNDYRFNDQIALALAHLTVLLECSRSIIKQIKIYDDRIKENNDLENERRIEDAQRKRTVYQNRWMIVWGFTGAFFAIIGVIISIIGTDQQKWELVKKLLFG